MTQPDKRVAGLRVPDAKSPAPPPKRKPHVVVHKTYECSECSFFSPLRIPVEQHIKRQHPEEKK